MLHKKSKYSLKMQTVMLANIDTLPQNKIEVLLCASKPTTTAIRSEESQNDEIVAESNVDLKE